MLTLTGIRKAHGSRELFADVALQVNRGDRLGLVGPNGAGKTTLFSLILGEASADDGTVSKERSCVVGYLPQESAPVGDETVVELACAITPDFVALRRVIQAWDHDHPVEAAHPENLHDDVHDRFHELDGYQVEARAKQILSGLGFRESDHERPAKELSGGWVMRAHLARLLTQQPDLLLLDEPTNHLDLETLLWFQEHLRGYAGALLVISHDREFLNAVVTGILEIRQRSLFRYTGNYDKFLAQRAANEAQHLSAYKNQQKEIAHLQAFVDRFKAKASKATQAQSKLKQIERMDKVEAPDARDQRVAFRFPQPIRSGQRVVWLDQVHFAYGATPVYRGVECEVERGERIVLVGPNGAGKSTLLKLLAGRVEPQQGVRGLGHNVTAGYYSQYRVEMLQPQRTVLEEAMDTRAKVPELSVRSLLGSFLFSGDAVFKKVEVLSGGEKSRLALVKLLLDPPNLLLMDEPTTHLDMSSIDALVEALLQFDGTLVFISHDVYFIRKLANKVVHVHAGRLTRYAGDYDFYLYKTKSLSAREALTAGGAGGGGGPAAAAAARPASRPAPGPGDAQKEQRQQEHRDRQARTAEQKRLRPLVDKLEQQIERLEARQKTLTADLEQPETWQDAARAAAASRELRETGERLAKSTAEWEAAARRLDELLRA